MFSSGRTVLFMTDEALHIYKATPRAIEPIDELPWGMEGLERKAAEIIADRCKKAPVLIINDMVEQHYRKERVLTSGVSVLDRKAMVDRKLNMAFPNYPVRAALPLKEKVKKEGGRMSSDVFIFAAVPSTHQFSKTINSMNISLAGTSGMCLLPIEIADMAKTLSKKLRQKSELEPTWVVLMGQHKSGGLRQVVIKNGEIALTRMSPLSDHNNHVIWAEEVSQEFNATMSYLTRFGFQAEDGLEVIMISDAEAAAAVTMKIDQRFGFKTLTPAEAAKKLGIKPHIDAKEHFTDVLHIAWINKKLSLTLPMSAQSLEQMAKPRQMANFAVAVLSVSALFLSYQTVSFFATNKSLTEDIDLKVSALNNTQEQYDAEAKKKEALGFDVKLIQSSVGVFTDMHEKSLNPLVFIVKVKQALGKDLKLDALSIKSLRKDPSENVPAFYAPQQGADEFSAEARLQFSYPSDADIDKGNREIEAFRDALAKILEGYEVEITKRLKDVNYVKAITVDSGGGKENEAEQDFIAQITVRKRLQ